MANKLELMYKKGNDLISPHWHQEYEIVYVVEGQLSLGIQQDLLSLGEEELYFIDSGITHYYMESPNCEYIIVKFDGHLFEMFPENPTNLTYSQIFEHCEPHSRDWPPSLQQEIAQRVLSLYEVQEEAPTFPEIESLYHLSALILLLLREVPRQAAEKVKVSPRTLKNKEILERLEQIYQYVDDYYQEDITIEKAAAILNVSSTYFARFFKKNVGITFHTFLNEHRINKAKYLLSQEMLPMGEIAQRSGFASTKTFHRVFKETEGLPPLKYQKLIIGKK